MKKRQKLFLLDMLYPEKKHNARKVQEIVKNNNKHKPKKQISEVHQNFQKPRLHMTNYQKM